jgi:hypothetical protein
MAHEHQLPALVAAHHRQTGPDPHAGRGGRGRPLPRVEREVRGLGDDPVEVARLDPEEEPVRAFLGHDAQPIAGRIHHHQRRRLAELGGLPLALRPGGRLGIAGRETHRAIAR